MNLVKIESEKIKNGECFIRVNKTGVFAISTELRRRLNLNTNDQVAIYQDQDEPKDWYLKIEEGLICRKGNNPYTSIIFNSASIAKKIFESIGFEGKSLVIPVSHEPIAGYYAFITSNKKFMENGRKISTKSN